MPVAAEVLRIDLYNRSTCRERLREITVTLLLDGVVVLSSGDVPLNRGAQQCSFLLLRLNVFLTKFLYNKFTFR